MIKFFKKIHLWLSVPFGLIIAAVCFAGAMLIFEPEITRSVNSDVYYVAQVKDTPIPMDKLLEGVQATLPDSVSITGVTVFDDSARAYQVNLDKPRRASVFVDQYTGEVTGRYERLGFFSAMFKLHRWLLDSANPHGDGPKVGKWLVGLSTLMFIVALVSGIVIWVPRARRNFRKFFSITVRKGWKGFWKSLHVAGGMYVVVLVLAMAVTGLTYSYDWWRTGFYAVCGVEHTPRQMADGGGQKKGNDGAQGRQGRGGEGRHGRGEGGQGRGGRGGHGQGRGEGRGQHQNGGQHRHNHDAQVAAVSEYAAWQGIYDQLSAANPDAPQITVSSGRAQVTISNYGNARAADTYTFDNASGKITATAKYADAPAGDKLRGWIYAIHTGSFGGWITRILWFLAALLGASLPLTGYYIWIRRLRKRHEAEHLAEEAHHAK